MHERIKIADKYYLESFNEEEAFSMGGPWRCNYKIGNSILYGDYLLDIHTLSEDKAICALVQFQSGKAWTNTAFYVVIIDSSVNSIFRLPKEFKALSILKITDDTIYYEESYNVRDACNAITLNWKENAGEYSRIE